MFCRMGSEGEKRPLAYGAEAQDHHVEGIQARGSVPRAPHEVPGGFCQWAWDHMLPHVKVMLYDDYQWNVNPGTWVVCCTDGLRPVVFKLEKAQPRCSYQSKT